MRHYEIVYLVSPNEPDQVQTLIDKHQSILAENEGKFHRLERWGRRDLAYQINNMSKAYYVLMNIECDQPTLEKVEGTFKFNDHILRHLTIRRKKAITESSFVVRNMNEQSESS